MAQTIWTIGHSTRPFQALIDALRAFEIAVLVDVRTAPRSRRHPWFNKEALPQSLGAADIEYRHMAGLGGWRKPRPDSANLGWRSGSFRGYADYMETPEFEGHLRELIKLAERNRTAIMCAEAVPYRCHRSLLSDALTAHGLQVLHIRGTTKSEPHRLTRFAVVEGGKVTYPGQLELPSTNGEPITADR